MEVSNKYYFTYIVECMDGTLYTGYTTDILKRIETHNSGKGAKYTRSRAPVSLVYAEKFETLNDALTREASIKKLSRLGKLKLITDFKLDDFLKNV